MKHKMESDWQKIQANCFYIFDWAIKISSPIKKQMTVLNHQCHIISIRCPCFVSCTCQNWSRIQIMTLIPKWPVIPNCCTRIHLTCCRYSYYCLSTWLNAQNHLDTRTKEAAKCRGEEPAYVRDHKRDGRDDGGWSMVVREALITCPLSSWV